MARVRLHELFDAWRQRNPERTFLQLRDEHGHTTDLSYDAVGAMTNELEHELLQAGIRPGDRVLAVAENCPQHVALILACSRLSAWSCGVNARMAPGEIAAIADKADARVCYFTEGVSDAAARHASAAGAMPSVVAGLSRTPTRTQAMAEPGLLAQEVAAVIFTSGTSGAPKGVMMTHEGVAHFGRVSAASRGLGPDDRSYAYLPMTHIFGLGTILVSSLCAGAELVMRTSFNPALALVDLADQGVTQLQGPPALFGRLLSALERQDRGRAHAPHLRYIYAGAGPLDMALKQRVETAFELPLHHGYGLSEYAGSLHITRRGEWRRDTASGHLVEGAQSRIVDPATGHDRPVGAAGEIWIRGVGLMPGYFRDPEATALVMRPGGWYATGDMGRVDEQGALFVVGRLKEMIIRSGFNVYPAEVEAALLAWPGIEAAAVVGRPAGEGNEDVIAYVVLGPNAALNEAALWSHLRERLAPYKLPSEIRPLPELPMTATGKVRKRDLLR